VNLGRILLIESDPATLRRRTLALQKLGYDVEVQQAARSGFEHAVASLPDCIVCNVLLDDIDGYWLARRLRTEEASAAATTPIVFIAPPEERESLAQCFKVGADAVLFLPVTDEEIAFQVSALIGMARRLRPKQELFVDVYGVSEEGAALRGDLSQMPLATILMTLEMERRRGTVTAITVGNRKATLVIAETGFVSSELDGKDKTPTEVLREVLHWKRGRFWYHPSAVSVVPGKSPAVRGSIGALLLDAMRLGDEATVLAPDEIEIDLASPSSRKLIP
jgi:two-component system OmpR family response regulator